MNEHFIDHGEDPDGFDEDGMNVDAQGLDIGPVPFDDALNDDYDDNGEYFSDSDDGQGPFLEPISHAGGEYDRGVTATRLMSIMTTSSTNQ